ncbi:MAG: 5-oxoprolinase subunit PxpB [Desulfobacterales bacterium]|nr:5-oxoprolinase subunit PxpB [Desulfobacterales bacterium]
MNTYKVPVVKPMGDKALLVEMGEGIDVDVNARVHALASLLTQYAPKGLETVVPTYRALMINYDPLVLAPAELEKAVLDLSGSLETVDAAAGKVVEIPVCYGGEFGPDMETVMATSGLSMDEVVKRHTAPEYLIYMVGFTPGFPFLGGMDESLSTPRLENPRTLVPEGSVGIANSQTGIYPVASPGGWQLIGKTPLKLFAPHRESPFLYQAGARIRFVAIDEGRFQEIAEAEKAY